MNQNKAILIPVVLTLAAAALPFAGLAQIPYVGGSYAQDFNTLASSSIYTYYTNLPAGWSIKGIQNGYVWTTVTNGYSNNYGVYCFSLASGAADKSIGLVQGSTGASHLGARFRNDSGVTLRAFTLSYVIEQWRKGAVAGSDQTIPFSFALDATNLTSGSYLNVPPLDLHSIHDGDGVAAALDGNAAANRQRVTATVSGFTWLPGQDLWIRWSGVAYSFFAAHALAIDDLTFQAVPTLQVTAVGPARLRFSWPTQYPGYSLQSAATPNGANWESMTNAPVTAGNEFSVEVDVTEAARFFRLETR